MWFTVIIEKTSHFFIVYIITTYHTYLQPGDVDTAATNVLLRLYYLDSYVTTNLDQTFTDKVKADLEVVQQQGWTVMLRFAYTENATAVTRTLHLFT